MESLAIFIFLMIETGALVFSYFRWLRDRSELPKARQRFLESLRTHLEDGSLDQHVNGLVARKEALFQKRKQLPILLMMGLAMIVGLVLSIAAFRLLTPVPMVKMIIAAVLNTPFMFLAAIAIAEEKDANNIVDYEDSMKEKLGEWAKGGSLKAKVVDMLEEGALRK